MTYQDHANAVLGLLAAAPGGPPLVVLDGYVPTGTTAPYVVVYFAFDAPAPETDPGSSDGLQRSNRLDAWAYCHCVGATEMAARAVAARVRSALLDVSPAVTSRSVWPIRHVENQPATRDESTGPLVVDLVDVYRLSSVPAT